MDFPVADLLDDELSELWLLKHFHPRGLKCPHCDARRSQARPFRRTRRPQVTIYRCRECHGLYNVYSGTIFQARHLRPGQVVLLLRGLCKGEPTAALARELSLHVPERGGKKAKSMPIPLTRHAAGLTSGAGTALTRKTARRSSARWGAKAAQPACGWWQGRTARP